TRFVCCFWISYLFFFFVFFFQAEDGIRDSSVTGVQTCALPILTEVALRAAFKSVQAGKQVAVLVPTTILAEQHGRTFRERLADRSEERRVGKEGRSRWWRGP